MIHVNDTLMPSICVYHQLYTHKKANKLLLDLSNEDVSKTFVPHRKHPFYYSYDTFDFPR